jgi:RHS repeat-associated protein
VLAHHVYFPFGEQAGTSQDTDQMKFTAHERDLQGTASVADDLDYMHARFYNPQLGRFLSTDPANSAESERPQSWNRYAYASGNPVRRIDPDGRRDQNYDSCCYTDSKDFDKQIAFDSRVAKGTALTALAFLDLILPGPGPADATLGFSAGRVLGGGLTGGAGRQTAYEIAAAGGRHAGTLRNYASRSRAEIVRAIRGYERQVEEHIDKIANPTRYIKDWDKLTQQQRDGLLRKWAKDKERNQELADVLGGYLRHAGE